MDKDSRETLNNGISGKLNDVQRGLKPQEAAQKNLASSRDQFDSIRTYQFLGFDAEALTRVASSIRPENVVNLIRGELNPDGISRNYVNGLYFQYGIPDMISLQNRSYKSWISSEIPSIREIRIGFGIGGGWFINDSANIRYFDFWRYPIGRVGNPLVYRLIHDLQNIAKARMAVFQLQLLASQRMGHMLDPALTLVNAYREFDSVPNRTFGLSLRAEVQSYIHGGLDHLWTELPLLIRGGFIRDNFSAVESRAGDTFQNIEVTGTNEQFGETHPAILRIGEIIEATGATLSYKRNLVQGELISSGLFRHDMNYSQRIMRIWTMAKFCAPRTTRNLIFNNNRTDAWHIYNIPRSIENIMYLYGPPVILKRAHVSAAEAELLDNLLIIPAKNLYHNQRNQRI